MRIFISHASEDKQLAQDIASRLKEAGYESWLAEDYLLPGDNWALATGKALEQSDAMLVLISPESMDSSSVRNEISYALGSPRYADRLIPLLVRPADDIPWILRKLNPIRVGKNRSDVVRQVTELLERATV